MREVTGLVVSGILVIAVGIQSLTLRNYMKRNKSLKELYNSAGSSSGSGIVRVAYWKNGFIQHDYKECLISTSGVEVVRLNGEIFNRYGSTDIYIKAEVKEIKEMLVLEDYRRRGAW